MTSANAYSVVAVIEDAHSDVKARITVRRNPRGIDQLSYQLFRAYRHKGEALETTWFSARHADGIARVLGDVDERLRLERERIVREGGGGRQ